MGRSVEPGVFLFHIDGELVGDVLEFLVNLFESFYHDSTYVLVAMLWVCLVSEDDDSGRVFDQVLDHFSVKPLIVSCIVYGTVPLGGVTCQVIEGVLVPWLLIEVKMIREIHVSYGLSIHN